MILACLLLIIAVAGGGFLSYLYQGTASLTLRLCLGTATGLALLATLGFLFGSFLGLTAASIWISAGLLLLPASILLKPGFRARLVDQVRLGAGQLRSRKLLGSILLYAGLALMLGLAFGASMEQKDGSIYTADSQNLGDLPFHLNVISGFVYGNNVSVEDPSYAGVRFTYPILSDFLSAMLVRVGAPVQAALWLPNMALALAFIGLLQYWTRILTGDRLAAVFAPLLVIFSGGLGWGLLMQDLHETDGSILTLLGHLPHDYTIAGDAIFRWGNSLTCLLIPQRSFLFGLPLAICVCWQWWVAIESSSSSSAGIQSSRQQNPAEGTKDVAWTNPPVTRRMLAAGICAGLLPLVHTHGFLCVMGAALCLIPLFPRLWRGWRLFLITAIAVASPEAVWLAHSSINTRKFVEAWIGWDHGANNPVWFWFVNTGFFIPLLLAALLWRKSEYAVRGRLALFYAPFALGFIVPNFLRLSPWIWDNIKFLFYWYVASAPLVAFVLAQLWRHGSSRRWLAVGLLVSLTLSGGLDILRVVTHAAENREFTPDGIEIASLIRTVTPPRALILHATEWNSPVYLTGRRSLLAYSGWSWSRGLDTGQREMEIRSMYAGGPQAKALMKQEHVDYALIGPAEAPLAVDKNFWAGCSKLGEIGQYQLYKTDCK